MKRIMVLSIILGSLICGQKALSSDLHIDVQKQIYVSHWKCVCDAARYAENNIPKDAWKLLKKEDRFSLLRAIKPFDRGVGVTILDKKTTDGKLMYLMTSGRGKYKKDAWIDARNLKGIVPEHLVTEAIETKHREKCLRELYSEFGITEKEMKEIELRGVNENWPLY